jgi:hypothetical protein
MVIQVKWFCKLISVKGIMLWPFSIVNDKNNKVLVNHEKIHFRQANELWIIGFYWLYIFEYFKHKRSFKHLPPGIRGAFAYREISFEKEAFANQNNIEYLKTRKRNAWKKYK